MTDVCLDVIIPSSLKTSQIQYLRECLQSIFTQTEKVSLNVCVVSTGEPSRELKKEFPAVSFFTVKEKKVGFGEINNQALAYLNTKTKKRKRDWLLLLNDDARLKDDFFRQLSLLKPGKNLAAYAPMLLDANDSSSIDSYGVEYFRSGYAKNCLSTEITTTLATAGCLLIEGKFLEKFVETYGFFFSPIYFYYLEDVDLTLRMRMLNADILRVPSLVAYHHGSISSGGKKNTFSLFYTYRNILWVMICCWPLSAVLRNAPNILLVQMWVLLYSTLRCGVLTYPKILLETIKNTSSLLRYRKKTISAYDSNVKFQTLLSPYSFRTFHNKTVSAV